MKNKNFQRVWFIVLILTPIVLWILPGDFFDDSEVITCASRLLFDVECWGCGMTRAIMHFHNFQFDEALFFNTGVVFTYPFLIWLWYRWTRTAGEASGFIKQ